MDDLKNELAALRLDYEPPRSRRAAWMDIVLLVSVVAGGTTFWWGYGVLAATEVETTAPRVERSGGAPSGTPLLTASGYVVARGKAVGPVENRPVKPSSTSRLALIQVDKLPSTGIEHTIEAAQFGPRDGGGKSCNNGTSLWLTIWCRDVIDRG